MPRKRAEKTVQKRKSSSEEPAFSEDGVDLTLIRWMLSLTPTERPEALQDVLWSIAKLRGVDDETLAAERDRMK